MRKITYKNTMKMVKNNIPALGGLKQNTAECSQMAGWMFSGT